MATVAIPDDSPQDTIFAVSSGTGRTAVSVIRVSGPAASQVLERIAPPLPKPRFAAFRKLRHPDSGEDFDHALVLWFPGPKSETGEDACELQVHGGRAVLAATFAALSAIPGCRQAGPGEFARRAFENGKLDLTAAEGLADLIDAETDAQRRQALRQSSGELARLYDQWREAIIEARGLLEAAIDFSDEPDVESQAAAKGLAEAARLSDEIQRHLADGRRGEIVRDGFRIVLAGPPNVGKSSLMNAMARRDVAIVSDEPGTTRDVVEARLDLGGYMAIVADTAGLRDATGSIEREGIRRARQRAETADLILWLIDATTPVLSIPADLAGRGTRVLRILNKIDAADTLHQPAVDYAVSARTGQGLPGLITAISRLVSDATAGDEIAITQARHRQHLEDCLEALTRAHPTSQLGIELAAEQLRLAADALGRIVGRIDPEDVLDQVFARFCIGK